MAETTVLSLRVKSDLLASIDRAAKASGENRANYATLAVVQRLQREGEITPDAGDAEPETPPEQAGQAILTREQRLAYDFEKPEGEELERRAELVVKRYRLVPIEQARVEAATGNITKEGERFHHAKPGARFALTCPKCGRREFDRPTWKCPEHRLAEREANHSYFGQPTS